MFGWNRRMNSIVRRRLYRKMDTTSLTEIQAFQVGAGPRITVEIRLTQLTPGIPHGSLIAAPWSKFTFTASLERGLYALFQFVNPVSETPSFVVAPVSGHPDHYV